MTFIRFTSLYFLIVLVIFVAACGGDDQEDNNTGMSGGSQVTGEVTSKPTASARPSWTPRLTPSPSPTPELVAVSISELVQMTAAALGSIPGAESAVATMINTPFEFGDPNVKPGPDSYDYIVSQAQLTIEDYQDGQEITDTLRYLRLAEATIAASGLTGGETPDAILVGLTNSDHNLKSLWCRHNYDEALSAVWRAIRAFVLVNARVEDMAGTLPPGSVEDITSRWPAEELDSSRFPTCDSLKDRYTITTNAP